MSTQQQIVFVRHGRSGHVHKGWIDVAGFGRWRDAYEAAGIDEQDQPPPELKDLASASGLIVASDAPRAIQSAKMLDPRRHITTSPLLQELTLAPPNIGGVRMPLAAWALAFGVRWLARAALRRPHESVEEVERSRDAVQWLSNLAERHGSVVAITHNTFRSLLSRHLIEQGWRCEIPRRRSSHWSAWVLRR